MIGSEAAGQALEARVTRAARESGEMTFTQTESGWTVETKGGCYRVGQGYCGCPDWQYRGSRTGIPCKHQVAVGLLMIEKGLL